ncbi:uncharacterized protein LOC111404280 [Olea europaea var. sylvestris]|uniref:uncharacterized protein LOC111404280 n=1 Tax=Olea europaea var. sylvestris TaxID=158386 RepID=UPI000C1D2940|nr:uncharacterized protein LOC111404280 [Olea europaea var. sylvestris]
MQMFDLLRRSLIRLVQFIWWARAKFGLYCHDVLGLIMLGQYFGPLDFQAKAILMPEVCYSWIMWDLQLDKQQQFCLQATKSSIFPWCATYISRHDFGHGLLTREGKNFNLVTTKLKVV